MLFAFFALLLLGVVVREAESASSPLILTTKKGQVLGRQITSYGNQTGLIFLNIPYAEAPVGPLRFAKPLPKKPWTGILNGTEYGVACPADGERTYKVPEGGPMSEDCLQLNVFTNAHCIATKTCAVLAVLHGGGFSIESPVTFMSDVIVNNFAGQDRNIVVVTIGYRLGILSLINLRAGLKHPVGSTVSKNLAMHDALLALHWVQDEISTFGGHPRRVTLMGHSSGGAMADMLSFSPLSTGLYSQLLSQSANSIMHGSNLNREMNTKASHEITRRVGCATNETDWMSDAQFNAVIACLRRVPWKRLLKIQLSLVDSPRALGGPFLDDEVFPSSHFSLLSKRVQVPTMMGTTTKEMRSTRYLADENNNVNATLLRDTCLHYAYGFGFPHPEEAAARCQIEYSDAERVRDLSDDVGFYAATIRGAKSLTRTPTNPFFLYSYSYNASGEAYRWNGRSGIHESPKHSEDYIYIFGMHRGVFAPKDYVIERIYSGLFADFVNHGRPTTVAWDALDFTRLNYWHVDFDDQLRMPGQENGYHERAVRFWLDRQHGWTDDLSPLATFPPDFDGYSGETLNDAMKSYATGKSGNPDKTLDAELAAYAQWARHMDQLRVRHLFNATVDWFSGSPVRPPPLYTIDGRSAHLTESAEHGGETRTITTVFICLSIAIVAGLLITTAKQLLLRRRRSPAPFSDSTACYEMLD